MKEQEKCGREQKKRRKQKDLQTYGKGEQTDYVENAVSQVNVERWSTKSKWCPKDKALRPLPCLVEPVLKCSAKEVLVNPKDQSEADKMHSH